MDIVRKFLAMMATYLWPMIRSICMLLSLNTSCVPSKYIMFLIYFVRFCYCVFVIKIEHVFMKYDKVQHSFKIMSIRSYVHTFAATIYLNYQHTCVFEVDSMLRKVTQIHQKTDHLWCVSELSIILGLQIIWDRISDQSMVGFPNCRLHRIANYK